MLPECGGIRYAGAALRLRLTALPPIVPEQEVTTENELDTLAA
jgi:hypothetical protein